MVILRAEGGIASTACWLVADEQAKKAVLFDAPNDTTGPLLNECESRGWDLIGLWLTHGHFDHVADHEVVTRRFPKARLLMHKDDLSKITGEYPKLFPLPFEVPTRQPDGFLTDGQKLKIGNIDVEVMHTPGHAAGHMVYYFPAEKVLVGGDMIIGGTIGRVDLPDSDFPAMRKSLKRIIELPEETTLLPGHGEASNLAREFRTNCMLQDVLEDR